MRDRFCLFALGRAGPSRRGDHYVAAERHSYTSALPDDLLILVFSKMHLVDRLWSPSPVCKRWHRLCRSPALLREVEALLEIDMWAEPACDGYDTVRRARSLQAFLSRHGAALHSLDLHVSVLEGDYTAAQAARVLDQPRRALRVLAGPALLERLRLRWENLGDDIEDVQPTLNLVSKLSRLTALEISGHGMDYAAAPLQQLTALGQLNLEAPSWAVLAAQSAQLPSSLTKMKLLCSNEGELTLSPQLSALSALHHLTLSATDIFGGYQGLLGTLPCLPSLERLEVLGWSLVEAGFVSSLAALEQLRVLRVEALGDEYEENHRVILALAQLTQLTGLSSRIEAAT